jgi:L-amino acid N-acyltransferase YncA
LTDRGDSVSTPEFSIREAHPADAADLAEIYNLYIADSIATFEMDPIERGIMATRMEEGTEGRYPWLVAEVSEGIVGFAFARPFRPRSGYSPTAETSIYLSPSVTGRGIGRALYGRLLDRVRARGFHVAIATIALPNEASVALHESFGFAKVAHLPEVGRKFERWIDVGYWHLALE